MLEVLNDFLVSGGIFLWVIILTTFLMWAVIIYTHKRQMKWAKVISLAQISPEAKSHLFLSQMRFPINVMKALVGLLPLLGLLGTVHGMIESFLALGSGATLTAGSEITTQTLSAGISHALLTTLAGLVGALSGVYFVYVIRRRNDLIVKHLKLATLVNKKG